MKKKYIILQFMSNFVDCLSSIVAIVNQLVEKIMPTCVWVFVCFLILVGNGSSPLRVEY